MKLKNKFPLIWSALLLIGIVGCSKSEPTVPVGESPYTLAIAVQGEASLQTRTSVFDPDDQTLKGRQHVTRVQLYIYEDDGTDYTCVASEDVKWTHLQGTDQGLETREQGYTTIYQGYQDGKNYRFVAMGFDDTYTGTIDNPTFKNENSVAAYGAPDKQAIVRTETTAGAKLSEGKFSLQTGATESLMNKSELFAGAQTFTKADLKNGTASRTPIVLNRRVAGVMGYFKGLPDQIENTAVAKVVLRLYKAQNTAVKFLPVLPAGYKDSKLVPDAEYIDYITTDNGNERIIATYTPKTAGEPFNLSAYLLPIAASANKDICTLELAVQDADGKDLAVRRVLYTPTVQQQPGTRNGTGIIGGDEKNARMQYPIRANQFYRLGSKDKPIDLSGQSNDIYIYIDPVWDEYYGGTLEGTNNGIGIDKEWGSHDGGALDETTKPL